MGGGGGNTYEVCLRAAIVFLKARLLVLLGQIKVL